MTQLQREIFVSGFMDGSGDGKSGLCNALDKRELLSRDSCLHAGSAYTHGDLQNLGSFRYVDPYVVVISDFYKHSECRAMPYTYLMDHLNDAEFKTGDALYKFVRSGNASWGNFSGFDGIYDCYNADLKR